MQSGGVSSTATRRLTTSLRRDNPECDEVVRDRAERGGARATGIRRAAKPPARDALKNPHRRRADLSPKNTNASDDVERADDERSVEDRPSGTQTVTGRMSY